MDLRVCESIAKKLRLAKVDGCNALKVGSLLPSALVHTLLRGDFFTASQLDFCPFSASSCSQITCATEIRQEPVSGRTYGTRTYERGFRKRAEVELRRTS